ncbi:VOC family protein [Halosegnis marinus]|uniref:VOC family protein n=1 Tax=Halosegnis marinus TaxID=3034023 RepID=A0ABD5ZR46_9EURY|nr:VOC family protein [Halosegnis sp. DT85]
MDDDLPAGTRVGRVTLAVADLDRLADFYERVVGLELRERSDDRALLGAETGDPFLELRASDRPERGDDETGLFHVAFRVPDRTALGAAVERIERRWLLDGASDHLVSEALYFRDPEGNGIEVYRDRPRGEWPRTDDGGVEMDSLPLDTDALRADGDGAATVPDGTDVGHVHLEVSDVPAARDFYVGALGFGVRDEWVRDGAPEALFVAAGDYHHHVGLNTWYGCTEPATGLGLAVFELVLPDADALAAAEERLRAAGYDPERDDGGVTVADPDGIRLWLRPE